MLRRGGNSPNFPSVEAGFLCFWLLSVAAASLAPDAASAVLFRTSTQHEASVKIQMGDAGESAMMQSGVSSSSNGVLQAKLARRKLQVCAEQCA